MSTSSSIRPISGANFSPVVAGKEPARSELLNFSLTDLRLVCCLVGRGLAGGFQLLMYFSGVV